jgi:Rrf2 family transcriptional regulator, iron-sulfur cluster assembly transcription factor
MAFLPRKGLLAIAVVVDLALQTEGQLISAKTLAVRHGLPPRHLEPLLQSLVHNGASKASADRTEATNLCAIRRA